MSIHSEAIKITKALISRKSVTPEDAGCQHLMREYLEPLGFTCETMVFEDTTNLWATKGTDKPTFIFAGHTDVVPTGPIDKWMFDPFEPTEHEGYLYGRGAADMKCALAAMLTATKSFVEKHPQHNGQIAFLITSDEEGPFINGTIKVVETLKARGQSFDMCIVGEPSSTNQVGDTVKNGRRGSLSGFLHILGQQGHVAYPHLAENALHKSFPVLDKIAQHHWDNGNQFFPPTSLQITKVEAGCAINIIPGEAYIEFNCRFSTEQTDDAIKETIQRILEENHCDYQLDWKLSGLPFLTPEGKLLKAAQESIQEILDIKTELSTAGGTSDGRFIAQTGCDVIELGVCNESIHKVNEKVKTLDITVLSQLYERVLEKTLL
jgi:succinyl-diaminopimelate desuccinylase